MAAKRKRPIEVTASNGNIPPPPKRRQSARNASAAVSLNPNENADVIDAPDATRASPDAEVNPDILPGPIKTDEAKVESISYQTPSAAELPKKKGRGKKAAANDQYKSEKLIKSETVDSGVENVALATAVNNQKPKKPSISDEQGPEAEGDEEANEEEVREALSRPPPVNSDYLPLPWKGRLGYACLNTYLRNSNPPVFSSRTCRIQSILEHRHPLQDPTQPEHPTKNRPDRSKPADVELGKRYVEELCLANVRDISKMIRWNDRYNIKFLRLSSEMFPFASHAEYGYKLAPFAAEALAEAGKVIAELGHRVTTHPGQFTQLGSPRKQVIENAIRDLDYHDEMLSLLKLPEQQNKDAVMIMHMGGFFDGKEPTLQRFRENYAGLSQSVKNRLVLENDDVIWSVHDLLPICEELNIPFVLDFHHHNIIFDSDKIREGTMDIIDLYPRIKATWDRKGITQKMHYSEPTPQAITGRQRRKHNPRVATLPPCAPDMDLMIEAKDKEQAVFELMKTFKLPGHDSFNDILAYVRNDDNKAALAALSRKKKKADEPEPELIPDEDVGMGGPEGRVYWPPTMEEWLRPKKREVKKKEPADQAAKDQQTKKKLADLYAAKEAAKAANKKKGAPSAEEEAESDVDATPATKKAKAAMRKKAQADAVKAAEKVADADAKDQVAKAKKGRTAKRAAQPVPTPDPSEEESDVLELEDGEDEDSDDVPMKPAVNQRATASRKVAKRATKGRVSYKEEDDELADV